MVSSAIHGWIAKRLPIAPTAVRNAENGGPAGGRAVTAIENPRPSITTSPPDVPVSLPSSIFNFVPGTSPSWSPKVYVSDGRTPYVLCLWVQLHIGYSYSVNFLFLYCLDRSRGDPSAPARRPQPPRTNSIHDRTGTASPPRTPPRRTNSNTLYHGRAQHPHGQRPRPCLQLLRRDSVHFAQQARLRLLPIPGRPGASRASLPHDPTLQPWVLS